MTIGTSKNQGKVTCTLFDMLCETQCALNLYADKASDFASKNGFKIIAENDAVFMREYEKMEYDDCFIIRMFTEFELKPLIKSY